jgi:hypothetical protein
VSDYFTQLGRDLEKAVWARAHLPWHRRLRVRHPRALIGVLAVLVVGTPAVAAVSGFFGSGAPNAYGPVSGASGYGKAISGGVLLPIRVADPDGGPPWGLRLVRTSRGLTCVQVGRIVDGHLGSLGIDHYFDDDHRFHAIATNDYFADFCGTTDADGYGFVNARISGESSSAGSSYGDRGPQAAHCRIAGNGVPARIPICPPGSNRMVFLGLLGPKAKSITYLTPTGQRRTQETVGAVGAYLLVFRFDRAGCARYSATTFGVTARARAIDLATCLAGESGEAFNPALMASFGAVKMVSYSTGPVCDLTHESSLVRAYLRFEAKIRSIPLAQWRADAPLRRRFLRLWAAFHHAHPSADEGPDLLNPTCPLVGYVAPQAPRITRADVVSPIRVQVLPARFYCSQRHPPQTWIPCDGRVPAGYTRITRGMRDAVLAQVTYTARIAVHNDDSYYEVLIQNPVSRTCQGGGTGGPTDSDIRADQRMLVQNMVSSTCPGVYRGVISYMPQAGPGGSELGDGGQPGRDGSIIVGRFSFVIHRTP